MNTPSLLEKARMVQIKGRALKSINNEVIDLSVAWAKDEVSTQQVEIVMGRKRGTYQALALGLQAAVRKGILQ